MFQVCSHCYDRDHHGEYEEGFIIEGEKATEGLLPEKSQKDRVLSVSNKAKPDVSSFTETDWHFHY